MSVSQVTFPSSKASAPFAPSSPPSWGGILKSALIASLLLFSPNASTLENSNSSTSLILSNSSMTSTLEPQGPVNSIDPTSSSYTFKELTPEQLASFQEQNPSDQIRTDGGLFERINYIYNKIVSFPFNIFGFGREPIEQSVHEGNLEQVKAWASYKTFDLYNAELIRLLRISIQTKNDKITFYLLQKAIEINAIDEENLLDLFKSSLAVENIEALKLLMSHPIFSKLRGDNIFCLLLVASQSRHASDLSRGNNEALELLMTHPEFSKVEFHRKNTHHLIKVLCEIWNYDDLKKLMAHPVMSKLGDPFIDALIEATHREDSEWLAETKKVVYVLQFVEHFNYLFELNLNKNDIISMQFLLQDQCLSTSDVKKYYYGHSSVFGLRHNLQRALDQNNNEVLKLLMSDPMFPIILRDEDLINLFITAVDKNNIEGIKLLINHPRFSEIEVSFFGTIYRYVARLEKNEIMQLLLQHPKFSAIAKND